MVTEDKMFNQLKQLAASNGSAAFIFKHLAAQKKPKPNVDLYRLKLNCVKGGHFITIESIIDIFDKLSQLGLGKTRIRSLPNHSSFSWSKDKDEIKNILHEIILSLKQSHVSRSDSHSGAHVLKPHQTHTIDLYATIQGQLVHLQLPRQFDRSGAKELAAFLEQVAAKNETT